MESNRFRLGIIFNFNPKWTGGLIYILNVVKILNFLEEKDKPTVVVFFNPALQQYANEIDYPYLELVPHHFPTIYKGYLLSILQNKNLFVHDLAVSQKLDAILEQFPARDFKKMYYEPYDIRMKKAA